MTPQKFVSLFQTKTANPLGGSGTVAKKPVEPAGIPGTRMRASAMGSEKNESINKLQRRPQADSAALKKLPSALTDPGQDWANEVGRGAGQYGVAGLAAGGLGAVGMQGAGKALQNVKLRRGPTRLPQTIGRGMQRTRALGGLLALLGGGGAAYGAYKGNQQAGQNYQDALTQVQAKTGSASVLQERQPSEELTVMGGRKPSLLETAGVGGVGGLAGAAVGGMVPRKPKFNPNIIAKDLRHLPGYEAYGKMVGRTPSSLNNPRNVALGAILGALGMAGGSQLLGGSRGTQYRPALVPTTPPKAADKSMPA